LQNNQALDRLQFDLGCYSIKARDEYFSLQSKADHDFAICGFAAGLGVAVDSAVVRRGGG